MRNLIMPTRTIDYLLMGIIAGIIAGLILVYAFGVTYFAMASTAEGIKTSFGMP